MLKLGRYVKKFALSFLVIIGLLVVQAQAELALPQLMSNIIDGGIVNNGITTSVPDALREEQHNKITSLLTTDENKLIDSNYKLTKNEQTDEKTRTTFPLITEQDIYVINKDVVDEDKLSESLRYAETVISSIDNGLVDLEKEVEIPEGMDIYQLMALLPDEKKTEVRAEFEKEMAELGEVMIDGVAANFVKEEYIALGANIGDYQTSFLIRAGLRMLAVTLVSVLCAFGIGFLASRTAAGVSRLLRRDIYSKVQSFSARELDQFSTASLITRTTNDVQQIQGIIVNFFRIIVYAPIMAVGAIGKVLETNRDMSWIIAMIVVIMLVLIGIGFSIVNPRFRIIQKLTDKMNLVTRESLNGMLVIRAFNTQDRQVEKFEEVNDDVVQNHLFVGRTFSLLMPILNFLLNVAILYIIWVSANQIDLGLMQLGDMMAFIQYTMQIIMAFIMISMVAIMIPRASVAAKRIFEVLDTENIIIDKDEVKVIDPRAQHTVTFDQVSFRYPGAEADVLHDINLVAKPGETVSFIGSTGSGKSTLINLLPRFFDVTEGRIMIDDVDIRDLSQENLRESIAFVPQVANLFSGTIESNLQMGKQDATRNEMIEASTVAQAIDFIEEKDEQFESPIAQGGSNVSGGQKQRLAIARALIKEANILVFDDSFSALDFKTDSEVRAQLSKHQEENNSTVLIVGQRVSSIMDSDKIVVLDKGEIVGLGTHSELLNTCDVYYEIAKSQLTEEELEDGKTA